MNTLKFVTRQLPGGLRERNKAKRRDAILDGALALLREQPIGAVSIDRIAERAEVSPATVYNLVGTREQLLLALIDRVIDGLVDAIAERAAAGVDDPVATAELIVQQSADAFVADAAAYRQIIGVVGDFSACGSMMAFDPAQLQIGAMRDARAKGILRRDADPAAVGRQIYLSYNGALLAWAGLGLTDAGFVIAARHGLYTSLVAFATDEHRPRLARELARLGRRLVAAGWGRDGS